jgi:hypothetical protein
MKITHIRNRKDQWIFEYATAMEHDELKKFVSKLRDQFGAEFKEISDHSVEVPPIAE